MFELNGTQFERGVFELRLAKSLPGPLRWLAKLGPITGRFVALGLIVGATILEFQKQPARLFLNQGWITTQEQARSLQGGVTWTIFGIGLVIYLGVFVFRQESLRLVFDRGSSELLFLLRSARARGRLIEGRVDFKDIEKIEVFGPERAPKSPHGFIEIRFRPVPQFRSGVVRFRVPSEDQLRALPANLSKMVDKEPSGDWTPPDEDEPAPAMGSRSPEMSP